MRKLLAVLAGIIIIAIIIFMILSGLGVGLGKGSNDENQESKPNENNVVADKTDLVEESKVDPLKGSIIQVSVAKSDYFYENKTIELDQLVEILQNIDGKVVVEISDVEASLSYYNKLLDELKIHNISFVEKTEN